MSKREKVHYFPMGPYPCYVGFTQSKKAFDKEVRRLNALGAKMDKSKGAECHSFSKDKNGETIYIITVPKRKISRNQLAGILAHEATHVAQGIWVDIHEKNPGDEAEAYLIQHIVQCCLEKVKK